MRHGFLLIDKPVGPTSHDALQTVRRALHERKIGHLGTLDPMASGLLVLAVGAKALKAVELFDDLTKSYIADIKLGEVSTTYDREGVLEEYDIKPGWKQPDQSDVQRVIQDHFLGAIEQIPPVYSALNIGGQRAHAMARRGETVHMSPRSVHISECAIMEYEYPHVRLMVSCSSGTYIRSLANDIGHHLRCGGYLEGLRRTKVGEWLVDFSLPPDTVTWADVLPLKEALVHLPFVELSAEDAEHLRHGRDILLKIAPDTLAWYDEKPIAILVPSRKVQGYAHARKVF